MRLKLTWRMKGHKDIDLMVLSEQKISETMQVLVESGILDEAVAGSVRYVKSLRTNNQVNILLTYKEGQIYSGDILVLEDVWEIEEKEKM